MNAVFYGGIITFAIGEIILITGISLKKVMLKALTKINETVLN